jgi:hypothetical protein
MLICEYTMPPKTVPREIFVLDNDQHSARVLRLLKIQTHFVAAVTNVISYKYKTMLAE